MDFVDSIFPQVGLHKGICQIYKICILSIECDEKGKLFSLDIFRSNFYSEWQFVFYLCEEDSLREWVIELVNTISICF